MTKYRQVGGRLGAYIRANNPSTHQIQGLLADLLAGDKLLPTMREVVTMHEFAVLRELAGSGGGVIQRDALLGELAKRFLPAVVNETGELINGMLDQPPIAGKRVDYVGRIEELQRPPERQSPNKNQSANKSRDWGWADYKQAPLPGWERSPAKRPRTQHTAKEFDRLEPEQKGISMSELATQMEVPVGLLLQWCLRMGFSNGKVLTVDSRVPMGVAIRIASRYKKSSIAFAGQILIVIFLIVFIMIIISTFTS